MSPGMVRIDEAISNVAGTRQIEPALARSEPGTRWLLLPLLVGIVLLEANALAIYVRYGAGSLEEGPIVSRVVNDEQQCLRDAAGTHACALQP
jgi:hypothetical protein